MSDTEKELFFIRKYLLGGLKKEEREQVEQRVLTDRDFRDSILMVEEDLIEEFAEGALNEADRESFRRMFYSSAQRRREVEIVGELKQYAASGGDEVASTHVSRSATYVASLRDWLASLWLLRKPVFAVVAVVIAVVVFFAVRRLTSPVQGPGPLTHEQQRRANIERELARLNYPQGSESRPPHNTAGPVALAVLSPGLSRGNESMPAGNFPTLRLPPSAEAAQLRLLLRPSAREYQSFQATLAPVGASEPFKVDLGPGEPGADALYLTLPARELDEGDYQVQLSGRAADGRTEALPDHYYSFRLARQ